MYCTVGTVEPAKVVIEQVGIPFKWEQSGQTVNIEIR